MICPRPRTCSQVEWSLASDAHPLAPMRLLAWAETRGPIVRYALLFLERCIRQLTRLLRYLAPYSWQFVPSVLLLAGVGFLDAFRVLLVEPVIDRVLNPSSGSE